MITQNDYKLNTENEYIERDNLAVVKLAEQLATLTDEPIKIVGDIDKHLDIIVTELYPIHFRYTGYGTNKEYMFGIWYNLKYINYDDIAEIKQPEPNKIRTLNEKSGKKVAEWINYYKLQYGELVKRSAEKQEQVDCFVKNFKHVLQNLTNRGEYNYIREGTRGYNDDVTPDGSYSGILTRGGLMYEFNINTNGYISQDIKLHCYPIKEDINTFLKLSDNKL